MRINGNYVERFMFTLFPWVLVGSLLGFFGVTKNIFIIVLAMIFLSVALFLIDTLHLKKYNLLKVTLSEKGLYANGKLITEDKISIIRPSKTSPPGSCLIIEFYLNENMCLKFMDKPKSFLYKPKNRVGSKSLDLLFEKMPALKKKIRAQHF